MPARRAPKDLGIEGAALWRSIEQWRLEQGLAFDPHELPLVAELARQVDRLASLRSAIAATVPNDPAWTRMAAEERLGRVTYGRLVAQLGLPSGVVPDAEASAKVVGLSPSSRRAQKAARARWGQAGEVRHAS